MLFIVMVAWMDCSGRRLCGLATLSTSAKHISILMLVLNSIPTLYYAKLCLV